MKVYKFIFLVGLTNLIVPFMGIPFAFKQYIIVALAGVTIAYALILRAIAKEKENFKKQEFAKSNPVSQTTQVSSEPKKIEDVVEMQELQVDTPIKKTIRKPRTSKVLIKSTQEYE